MDLSLNFLNRNKPSKENNNTNVGEWKDPKVTHLTDDVSTITDFMCMYCLNIDSYTEFLTTSIDNPTRPRNIDVVPYSPDWSSFKQHMYGAHPEQWGYGEIPDSYVKIRKSRTSWSKRDKQEAANIYLQIRARVEYGWNFFAVVKGEIHRTLHALPKNESLIDSIEWYPRINQLTNKSWIDWRFEKEGETHRRAQNVLPFIIGRTHASIIPVLRGSRHTDEGQAHHILERNPKRLAKYAHLPLYVNATCIFTDDGLEKVQNIRDNLQLSGPGNIGILRWQLNKHHNTKPSQSVDAPVMENETGNIEKEKKVIKKEEVKKQVSEQTIIDHPSINVHDIAITLEQLLPQNDFTTTLMGQINSIFEYVVEQSQHEEDFYKVQDELDTLKNELKEVRADNAKDFIEYKDTTRILTTKLEAALKHEYAERDDYKEQLATSKSYAKDLQAQIVKLTKTSVIKKIEEASEQTKDSIRRPTSHPRFTS
jgi:hypothetical protein